MNEYVSTVEGEKRAIKILNDELLQLDSRETEYSLLKTSDTSYILKIGDKVFDIVASNLGSDKFGFLIDGSYFEVEVKTALQEKAREHMKNSNGLKHHDEMRAPMPGLILKINKKAGEKIEIGDSVLILEAMKMENDLRSPSSGIIKEVRVKEGDSVEKNSVLLIIE